MTIGDLHARHLLHGAEDELQDVRQFRLRHMGWGCGAPPKAGVEPGAEGAEAPGPRKCGELEAGICEEVARVKPDIVVMAAFWLQYAYADWVRERIGFFARSACAELSSSGPLRSGLSEAITEIDMAAIRMCFHRAEGVVQFPGAPGRNGGHRPDDGAGLPAA